MRDICIFEDGHYSKLLPLVYLRPVYRLRCGMVTLEEKISRQYPQSKLTLFCRDYLAAVLKEEANCPVNESPSNEEGVLFLNGRLLLSESPALEGDEEIGLKDDIIVYARLNARNASLFTSQIALSDDPAGRLKSKGIKTVEVEATLISYPWDLIHHNPEQIKEDFKILAPQPAIEGRVDEGAHILNKNEVFIGAGTRVKPGVVLDAEEGPIYLGRNVTVFPNATIEGPAFVGDKSLIKTGAKIYEGTSIGEVCKVGGEVEESIIHSYSNKQHDGFLGHAYLGMWVNLGADTNNSDLKNNYGSVRVFVEGKLIDSGSLFVGLTMADHAKAGINTMFTTGTVVGVGSNVFGAGFPEKLVPSFSWGGKEDMVAYRLDKFIEASGRVMGRRKIELSAAAKELIRKVFEMTASERKTAGIK